VPPRELETLDRTISVLIRAIETHEGAATRFDARGDADSAAKVRTRLAATESRLDDLLARRVVSYPPRIKPV
jgi:hypothetical protein